jgi:hypothetical protein
MLAFLPTKYSDEPLQKDHIKISALPRYLVGLRAPPIFGLLAYSTPCWSK